MVQKTKEGIFGGTVYYQKTIELVSRRGNISMANPDRL